MATIQERNGKFNVKIRKQGVNVCKTFLTRESAAAWADRVEARIVNRQYKMTVADKTELLAPLLDIVPKRTLDALATIPYDLRELVEASVRAHDMMGIYFLLNRGEVVYVGQSACDVFHRLYKHKLDGKVFDAYTFIPCSASMLDELESKYIVAMMPMYNHSIRKTKPKTYVLSSATEDTYETA